MSLCTLEIWTKRQFGWTCPLIEQWRKKDIKTILVKTTDHEKTRFTVVLACLADGTHLKPMVIFKRKTVPKNLNFPRGVVVHAQEKRWMDEKGMRIWVEKVWACRPGGMLRVSHLY